MTYSHNPELSDEVVSTLTSLKEGDSVVFSDPTQAGSDLLRRNIYAWLFVNGLRGVFKISRETPKRIRVLRKVLPRPTIHSVERAFGPAQEFVLDCLLNIASEDEALACIRRGIAEGRLPVEDMEETLAEWRAKVGTGV